MTRVPYHRYLRYLVLAGDSADEITSHLLDLGYLPPPPEDIAFLRDTLVKGRLLTDEWRARCEVDMFDDTSADMDQAHWLVETAPARVVAERALLDKVPQRHVATIVTLKFARTVSERAVSLFRRGWWDTEELTAVDFAAYLARAGTRKPDPPAGVPLHLRPAAAAWAQGILPPEEELSTDDIIRALQVDAFMHYERARTIPSPSKQEEARKWAQLALRVSQVRRPKASGKVGGQQELPGLKPAVYYPDVQAPALEDIEQPDDDGGGDDVI